MTRHLARGRVYGSPLRTALPVLLHTAADRARGADVERFETAAAEHLGSPHAVCLPHARVALAMLLRALGFRPGTGVLMTPVTIPDVVNVVLDAGLQPRWVDLAPRTSRIDLLDLRRKADKSCGLVLVTHLCGLPAPMSELRAIADSRGLILIEDASQAVGTTVGGRAFGTFGLAGIFSLTTLKPVSTFLGGLLLTSDAALAGRLRGEGAALPAPDRRAFTRRLLRDLLLDATTRPPLYDPFVHALVRVGEAACPAAIARLQRGDLPLLPGGGLAATRRRLPAWMWTRYTDLQARIGLRRLAALAPETRRRRRLALRLHDRLVAGRAPGVPSLSEGRGSFWRYPYHLDEPSTFARELRGLGIDTAPTNLAGNHREPAFAPVAARCPHADAFLDHTRFLPLHPDMSEPRIDHLAEAVLALHARGLR